MFASESSEANVEFESCFLEDIATVATISQQLVEFMICLHSKSTSFQANLPQTSHANSLAFMRKSTTGTSNPLSRVLEQDQRATEPLAEASSVPRQSKFWVISGGNLGRRETICHFSPLPRQKSKPLSGKMSGRCHPWL